MAKKSALIPPVRVEDKVDKALRALAKKERRGFSDFLRILYEDKINGKI